MAKAASTNIANALENELLAVNLQRVDRLARRGLLLFLDLETSKRNTAALRTKARLKAIDDPAVDVDRDLARIEQMETH